MQYLFLKPKEGLEVHHPRSPKKLKAEGERVVKSTYWQRRLWDGDVFEYQPEAKLVSKITEEKNHGDLV